MSDSSSIKYVIEVKNLCHTYLKGTPMQVAALSDVTFSVASGEFVGIIGHTGSGKSTLVQHLDGLIKPERPGQVVVAGIDIGGRRANLREVRRKVGLLFQYAENQVFEETVFADVAFGPKNLGLGENEVARRVRAALEAVRLNFEAVHDRSPHELSGGELRRVALAGVLAMQPDILILDEPTAGLDPRGRDEVLAELKRLHARLELTTLLVTHSMEEVAALADRLLVMHEGGLVANGSPAEIFRQADMLQGIGLGVPQVAILAGELAKIGLPISRPVVTLDEAEVEFLAAWKRAGKTRAKVKPNA